MMRFYFDVWKGSYGGICAVDEYLKKKRSSGRGGGKRDDYGSRIREGNMTVEMTVIGWYSIIEFRLMRGRRSLRPCN